MNEWCATAGAAIYRDKEAAVRLLKAAKVLYDHGRLRRRPCGTYWCQHCDGWHTTSLPERVSDD